MPKFPALSLSPAEYPVARKAQSGWVLSKRGPRNTVNPSRPYEFLIESEPSPNGELISGTVIFLTNAECPWKCVMCDLWRNTLLNPVQPGDIPKQIEYALHRLPGTRQVKLYNSGSFFDPNAIPPIDHPAIGELVKQFVRVVVECHPSLVGDSARGFRKLISGRLEVAMGLETVHPEALERLNKRMTLEDFERAAMFLRENEIDLRSFVLVQPPFVPSQEAVCWAERSAAFAFEKGATAVSLIPTRFGNGALESLAAEGNFSPPTLRTFEDSFSSALNLRRGRVFADLWDLKTFSECEKCFPARRDRLDRMNLEQIILPAVACDCET